MGYETWDMVQGDIKTGMSMRVVWVPCVLFVQIQTGIFFCCFSDTPQSIAFLLLIFDCLSSPRSIQ